MVLFLIHKKERGVEMKSTNKIYTETIERTEFSDEMNRSYVDYAMSVIIGRALPDARDGLKPVQRRVLYDMADLHTFSNMPTKKSARIVGDTMGKYHPHGDSSIYESLVVMTQDFKKRMPLVFGQGNFGSIEGDGAAAQRYTEVRLTKFTEDVLLKGLDKTVPFTKNYDGTETEPEVLPARLPLILLNGADGIAVGMATSIPSHNLVELCDLCNAYVDNPDMTTKEMLFFLKGPDFSTGGIIANKSDLESIYETGVGKLKIRGNVQFEPSIGRGDHDKLVITEIPYTMVGSGINRFLNDVASLVTDKILPEIVDISNQTNKDGIRIVLELRNGADTERIKNILYKKTKLEDTFGINLLAIKGKRPEILSLRDILQIWLDFQRDIFHRKYSSLLAQQKSRIELLEGLLKACDMIDLIIEIVRGSESIPDAKLCLMNGDIKPIRFKTKTMANRASKMSFTEVQAEAILKMPLQKLIGLELQDLDKEYKKIVNLVKETESILSNNKKQDALIKQDIAYFKKEFKQPRMTKLMDCEDIVLDDKKERLAYHLLIDKFMYAKLLDDITYERNRSSIIKEYLFDTLVYSDESLFVFSDSGKLYQLKIEKIPCCKYRDKGTPLETLISLPSSDKIIKVLSSSHSDELLFVTAKGNIKMVSSDEFNNNRKMINATKLQKDDCLICVEPLNKKKYILLKSKKGYLLKVNASEVPLLRKTAEGVKSMDLQDDLIDEVSIVDNTDVYQVNGHDINVAKIKSGKRGTKGKMLK